MDILFCNSLSKIEAKLETASDKTAVELEQQLRTLKKARNAAARKLDRASDQTATGLESLGDDIETATDNLAGTPNDDQ